MQAHNTPTFDPTRSPDSLNDLPRVTVNGVPFAYREHGTGEPVVLVHGSVSDIRSWQQPLSAISESHRAIAYSRRYARPNDDIPPGVDDQMLPHVADLAALLEQRKQQMHENVNAFRAQMLGAGFPPLTEDQVRGVTAPALLINGEQTPAFQRHLSDRLYQLLLRAERTTITAGSHRLHEENPTPVNEAILSFINEHGRRTTHEAA